MYDPGVLCVAKAEYGGKTEYLYFPCEEEAIDKAFARLGTTADEVKITLEDFNTDSPEWFGRFREIASEEGVYELNRLTAAVNTADIDLKKLWSVAEYAEAEDAEQLTRLAKNIGCFTFIEGATSYAEVGRFFTETEDRYKIVIENIDDPKDIVCDGDCENCPIADMDCDGDCEDCPCSDNCDESEAN